MLINRADYQRTVTERDEARGQALELTRRAESQQVLIDFLCAQINQLSKERSVLLRHTTHLEFPIPEIRSAPRTTREAATLMTALGSTALFDGLDDGVIED